MSTIEVAGLEFGYQHQPVLRGVDLHVESGTVTAVIGPSGCGKTTLLRLIAGFERPRAGSITLGDAEVCGPQSHWTPDRRRVGIVPQEGALFPHLDVAGNVGFALPRRSAGRAERIAELLSLIALDGLGHRWPRELSGGQQQRVALARALAPRPQVVMLDEPFASLDPDTRVAVRGEVRDVLAREQATTLLVTHDREEALSMADQVAVMLDGRIVQVAEPETAYAQPTSRRVATLLGEATFLPVLRRLGDRVETALGSLRVAPGATGAEAMVRPEQVRLLAGGAPGRVLDAQFVGSSTRVSAELSPGIEVTARLSGPRPRVGETIGLGVEGVVHLLPAAPEGHLPPHP